MVTTTVRDHLGWRGDMGTKRTSRVGSRAKFVGASALVAGTLPLALGQGVAAAGESVDERSVTFTYQGRTVTCTAEAWSSVHDDGPTPGSAAVSSTTVTNRPACAANLSLFVGWVDTAGTAHHPNAYAYNTTESVIFSTGGVRENYATAHTGTFLHCSNPSPDYCYFELHTAPK
jgi:hypothetical protein